VALSQTHVRIAEVDLLIRRFLGYGLTEALPHHATFSYAQCVRFANSSLFEQLFTQVLASCRDAGLLRPAPGAPPRLAELL
jgi:Transposase domain (DUF772)